MTLRFPVAFFGLFVPLALSGCGDDSGATGSGGGAVTGDGGVNGGDGSSSSGSGNGSESGLDYLSELEETGFFDYLGQFEPASETVDGDVTTYTFEATPEGPVCIDGSPFKMGVRDQGSDSLVFYLQGGGAC